MRLLPWLLLLCALSAKAQNWEVNLAQYEHRMSITCHLVIDQSYSVDSADRVGAYVGNELRGVGKLSFLHDETGYGTVLFQIGSNSPAGDSITFKMFDASRDQTVNAQTTLLFDSDGIVGSIEEPFLISDSDLYPEGELKYNNYISPNGDGVNDYLVIRDVALYEDFVLTIYTVEGFLIFRSEDYGNDWSGTHDGNPLPLGDYYFTFENPSIDKIFYGSFSLKNR